MPVKWGIDFESACGCGRFCFYSEGEGHLGCTWNGQPLANFTQMNFREDGGLHLPELGRSAKLPQAGRACLTQMLQRLAQSAALGVEFEDACGGGRLIFTLAGNETLQYTVDGTVFPPLSQMCFTEYGLIEFPELGTQAQLPCERRLDLTQQLQRLAQRAMLAVEFEEARRGGTIIFCVAAEGRLQYSNDGVIQPPFSQMTFGDDGLLDFPELGQDALMPVGRQDKLVQQLQRMALRAQLAVKFEDGYGSGMICFTVAGGGGGRLQFSVNNTMQTPICEMTFRQGGVIEFPEIQRSIKLPAERQAYLMQEVQRLAQIARLAVEVEPANGAGLLGDGTVCFNVAGGGSLQYTVAGSARMPFRQMVFQEAGVEFPELGTTAKLPPELCHQITLRLQRLAKRAGLGVEFEGANQEGTVCFTIAGSGCVQCTVDGAALPPVSYMSFNSSGQVSLPMPDGVKVFVQLPPSEKESLRQELLALARLAKERTSLNQQFRK